MAPMMENKAEHMAIGIGAEIELLASHFNRSAPCQQPVLRIESWMAQPERETKRSRQINRAMN
jgi:hypothetical protein